MRNLRGDHSELLKWLGRDLFGVAIEAWTERLSDDDIGSRLEALPSFKGLPPAIHDGAAFSVTQAVRDMDAKRKQIADSRTKWVDPLAKPFSDRLCRGVVRRLKAGANSSFYFRCLSNAKINLVSDDADVGISVIDASDSVVPGSRHELSLRAGSLKTVWEAGLGWTADNCLNLNLRSIDTSVPGFAAYAAIWVDGSEKCLQRRDGVMLVHRATGAVRHGADLRAALERPIDFSEAEEFVRASLQPLERAGRQKRAIGYYRDGKVELPMELAERFRAHLIWIGHQLGGVLEEIFSSMARKGYMLRLTKRQMDLFTIRSGKFAYFPTSPYTPLTCLAELLDLLPTVPMASTAHERIFTSAFRRTYGDEGLNFRAKAPSYG